MNILAIQLGHNATALVASDGQILACNSQERFDNYKNSAAYPQAAIHWCLQRSGLNASDITHIAICSEIQHLSSLTDTPGPEATSAAQSNILRWYGMADSIWGYSPLMRAVTKYRFWRMSQRSNKATSIIHDRLRAAGFENAKIEKVPHHLCHTYAPAYALPHGKEPILIFTMDGAGDEDFATISIMRDGKISQIARSPWCHSVGFVYSMVTKYLGMKILEHEYKVMGLAAYGKEKYFMPTYEKLFKGKVDLDPANPLTFTSSFPMNRFDHYLVRHAPYERFDNIAAALQYFLEDLVTRWVRAAIAQTGIRRIVTSGGVFMNVKLNKRIQEMPEVESAFFMPSCGDESNPFGGAAYLAEKAGQPLRPVQNLYLGHQYTVTDIESFIASKGLYDRYQVTKPENINERIAELLANFEVVGRFSGAAEFGARSLGNRAILANPSDIRSFFYVNDLVKSRDFWMPFAPSILDTDADRYLVNPKKIAAPHMITAFDSTPEGQQDLRAAIHQGDKTLRPQVVTRDSNAEYYDLISRFKQRTGIGGVLNTSLNIHGYPLASTLEQGLFTFENSGLRHLALGHILISKPST